MSHLSPRCRSGRLGPKPGVVRGGRSALGFQVDVTDAGRDRALAALSTIAFRVLAPKP